MSASQVHPFILTAALISFPTSSDACNENKPLDRRKITQQSSLFTNPYHSCFIKAIEHFFYAFTGVISPRAMLGETLEKLVIHEPAAHRKGVLLLK